VQETKTVTDNKQDTNNPYQYKNDDSAIDRIQMLQKKIYVQRAILIQMQ